MKNKEITTIEKQFRLESGIVDWDSLLWHIWENKSDGKTMTEWAKEFNVHPVTLTNKYTGFQSFAKVAERDQSTFSSAVTRQALNNKKNMYKVSLERREVNNIIRKEAMAERALEQVIIPNIKSFRPAKFNKVKENTDTTQIFFITDLHYTNAKLNENLKDLGDMILRNWDNSNTIVVVWGGDYIENRHHFDQQLKTASAINQATEVADVMAQALAKVLSNTDAEVHSVFLIGNHDGIRQGNEKSGDNLQEHVVGNIQKVISLLLKEYDKYYEIGLPTYVHTHKLGDRMFNFRHGHIGNIADKMLQKKMIEEELQTGETYDHYVFGHFHRWNDWTIKGTTKRFTICPSMKTYDGNFENSRVLRSTVGITTFKENGETIFIPWNGKKKTDGELI